LIRIRHLHFVYVPKLIAKTIGFVKCLEAIVVTFEAVGFLFTHNPIIRLLVVVKVSINAKQLIDSILAFVVQSTNFRLTKVKLS
jgi:hypothetical protein